MIDKHLLKLRARYDISEAEESLIRSFVSPPTEVAAKQTVIRGGDLLSRSTLLLEGMMCRYKDLANGTRQITELHVAGDFVDLHSFTLKSLDHNIMALTPCTIATVDHSDLKRVTEESPHLTRVYWFTTNLDAAVHREWVLSLGRRSAISRTAHLFCELHVRLGIVGLADDNGFDLALTQVDLAECLGMTAVHLNRTLRDLRDQKIVQFRSRRVVIGDLAQMRRTAEFSTEYLYLDKEPR
jgi:CRP-like cAMP-binding protein